MSDFVLYRFWQDDELLYVGISIRAYQRFTEHQATSSFFGEATNITLERFDNLHDLQQAESEAIANESPKYNVARPTVSATHPQHCCAMHTELLRARAKAQHERIQQSGLAWGVDVGPISKLPNEVVALILSLTEQGLSMRKIAAYLNSEKIPTARGAQWQAVQISRVLSSPRKKIREMKL
jgi:predicted GIY-YIG superfamily endonuclease